MIASRPFFHFLIRVPLESFSELPSTETDIQRIYIVRHAECELDCSGEFILTENGKKQAIKAGEEILSKMKSSEVVILSSTAVRAKQTAELMFKQILNQTIEEHDGFCELTFGKWEGKKDKNSDPEFKKAVTDWTNASAKVKVESKKYVTGESYEDVSRRALAALQEISDRYKDKTIFIASHAATMEALGVSLSHQKDKLSDEPGSQLGMSPTNCSMLLVEIFRKKSPDEEFINKAKLKMLIEPDVRINSKQQ